MDVTILFTASNGMISNLIRAVTKEPVSHVAVQVGDFVIHADFDGVIIEPIEHFKKKNDIIYRTYMYVNFENYVYVLDKFGAKYDYLGLFFLGFRYLFPTLLPKRNIWQQSGMFLCTELVTGLVSEKEDSMITPFGLYNKIMGNLFIKKD